MTDTPRIALIESLRDSLGDVTVTVDQGPMEGEKVVKWSDVDFALSAPLPDPGVFGAEVSTPASVDVWAVCPRCGQTATIHLTVGAELRVDEHAATLHLKGKSKPASHICGQTSASVAGQDDFGLEDIVGHEPPEDETPAEV